MDRELVDLVFQANDLLLQRKQQEQAQHKYLQIEYDFKKKLENEMFEIKRIAAYLAFETHNSI